MFLYVNLTYPNEGKMLKAIWLLCAYCTEKNLQGIIWNKRMRVFFLQSFGVRSFLCLLFQYMIFIEELKSLWVTTRWPGSQALVLTIAYAKFVLLQTSTIDPDPWTGRTGTKTDKEVAIWAKPLVFLWVDKVFMAFSVCQSNIET